MTSRQMWVIDAASVFPSGALRSITLEAEEFRKLVEEMAEGVGLGRIAGVEHYGRWLAADRVTVYTPKGPVWVEVTETVTWSARDLIDDH